MKNLSLIIFFTLFLSCVQTEDFSPPEYVIQEPDIEPSSNIEALKKAYDQSGEKIYTFAPGDLTVVGAYVISSDEAGNFYKLMVVQDQPENPSAGIEILIDLKAYYTKYNFGRKVYIKMAGLSITGENGRYTIGTPEQNRLVSIPESLLDDYIVRSEITEEIVPKNMLFSEFSKKDLDLYVKTDNVQFRHDELGKTFAGEAYDQYAAERILIQCDDQLSSTLITSTYASYRSALLPENKGSLQAVLSLDYSAKQFVLLMNDPETLDFTQNNRCDPEFLYCDGNTNSENLLFYEDFEGIKRTDDLEDLGWFNINVNGGSGKFKKRTVNGNVVMRVSAYDTGENPMETWLITPEIELTQTSNAVLNFQTRATYYNGSILTVWVSTDFKDDVKNATWQQLNATISNGSVSGYLDDFTSSGMISLSCLTGKIRIAFKYLGGDPGISTTYEVDKVKITIE